MTDSKLSEYLSKTASPLVREAVAEAIKIVLSDDAVWSTVDEELSINYSSGVPYLTFIGGDARIGLCVDGAELNCDGPLNIYGTAADYEIRSGDLSPAQKEEVGEWVSGMNAMIKTLTAERDKLLALAG